MTILCIGGGSIGHTAPCVAVARALRSLDPGINVHVACADREEEELFLTTENLPHTTLPLPHRGFLFPLSLLRSLRQSKRLLRRLRPDVVFCKGGALCIAPAWAAHRMGIPIVLHESDAVMGRANRLISRWARTVCLGMESVSGSRISNSTVTGNPIRPELKHSNREEGLRITGFSGTRPILLVLGGSQGAEALNGFIRNHLPELLKVCDVAHVTGPGKASAGVQPGYWSSAFALREYPHLFSLAFLSLSRAGAGTISELAANGVPTILIPLEGLAQDHQLKNAEAAVEGGGCLLVKQERMEAELLSEIRRLLSDESARKKMSENIGKLHRSDAAVSIAHFILEEEEKNQEPGK
ncbi:MAG: UDP-N-acetylglucosamine--N-acetylmuramyl-(pentapeptide) pyrophosphoryl-undecaprenol N-acetylglucosamine transferase [Candidatus Peribacteraceae bacterium]